MSFAEFRAELPQAKVKPATARIAIVTVPRAIFVVVAIGVATAAGWLSVSISDRQTPVAVATASKRQPPLPDTPTATPKQQTKLAITQDPHGPAGPLLAAHKHKVTPTVLHRFQKVEVLLPGGNIQADGRQLKIHGLTVPPRTKTCRKPNGERWACGLRAIVALYNLVAHSSMVCELNPGIKPSLGRCKIGPIDVAANMLRNGWGELTPGTKDEVYIEAQAAARDAKVGIWSDTDVAR